VIEEIYVKYLDTIVRWTRNNNGSKSDALDIFQEALTQILISSRKGKLELKTSFGAYLTSVCKYIWLGRLRKEKRLTVVRIEDNDTPTIEIDTKMDEHQKDSWLHTFLERNKLKLSDTCVQLLTLIAKNTPVPAIAEKLGMPRANTVYRRKFACLKKWREYIELDPLYHQWKEAQDGH